MQFLWALPRGLCDVNGNSCLNDSGQYPSGNDLGDGDLHLALKLFQKVHRLRGAATLTAYLLHFFASRKEPLGMIRFSG